jgi:hypothetical protein
MTAMTCVLVTPWWRSRTVRGGDAEATRILVGPTRRGTSTSGRVTSVVARWFPVRVDTVNMYIGETFREFHAVLSLSSQGFRGLAGCVRGSVPRDTP